MNWGLFKFCLYAYLPFIIAAAQQELEAGHIEIANGLMNEAGNMVSDLEQFFVQYSEANN